MYVKLLNSGRPSGKYDDHRRSTTERVVAELDLNKRIDLFGNVIIAPFALYNEFFLESASIGLQTNSYYLVPSRGQNNLF